MHYATFMPDIRYRERIHTITRRHNFLALWNLHSGNTILEKVKACCAQQCRTTPLTSDIVPMPVYEVLVHTGEHIYDTAVAPCTLQQRC